MTTIVFHDAAGNAEISLQTSARLTIMGAALSAGGPLLASFQDGSWRLGASSFERITWQGRIHVEFKGEKGCRTLGPFAELTIADGVISTEAVLARYSSLDEVWCCEDTSLAESVVVSEYVEPLEG